METPTDTRDTRVDTPTDGTAKVSGEALVRRLAEGRERFLAFARARTRDPSDAEDVLQHALFRAARAAEAGVLVEHPEGWFFSVLRRALADHHAEARRRAARESLVAEPEGIEAAAAAPEDPPASCACAPELARGLKAEYRDMLERVDLGDQAVAEAASALGVTANNAAVRLHRARKALRTKLEACCRTTSLADCLECSCDGERRCGA